MDRKKLLSTIKTLALQLNNKLPDNVGYYWVTYEELHQRLIHAGVSKLLSLDHVKDAVNRSNKGQRFLAVWTFNNTNYYRSKIIDVKDGIKVDVPLDQRYKAKVTPVKKIGSTLQMPRQQPQELPDLILIRLLIISNTMV